MYTLCGTRTYRKWNFKCHLGDKYIGKGSLNGDLIVIENEKSHISFRKNSVLFRLTDTCKHKKCDSKDPYTYNCNIQGFGDSINHSDLVSNSITKRADCKSDTNYDLCGTLIDGGTTWVIDHCYLGKKSIGNGELDYAANVFKIDNPHDTTFICGKCAYFKLEDKCTNHTYETPILVKGNGNLMTIKKHVPYTFETLREMKMISLNEPFICINDEYLLHESLFIDKDTDKIQVSITGYQVNCINIPITLECLCCNEIKTIFYTSSY